VRSGSKTSPSNRESRGNPRARAEAAHKKSRQRPMLEGPALVLWLVIVDVVSVHGYWLLTEGVTYTQASLLHISFLSLATLWFFGLDKWRARKDGRRVSEANLLALGVVGGAVGGLLGMVLFRHKLRSLKFRILLPASLLLHVALVLALHFTNI